MSCHLASDLVCQKMQDAWSLVYRHPNDANELNTIHVIEGFFVVSFRERRRPFSPDPCAAEVAPKYSQSSTGSVVINAILPRRLCLKA